MADQSRKLQDILVVCVLRYGQTQDNRFALAALVTCQALTEVIRREAIGYTEGRLREIQDRVVATIPQQSKPDASYKTVAAFVRSIELAEMLKGERAAGSASHRAKVSLQRIAPELVEAVETYDLRAVYNFLKPENAFRVAPL